MAKNERPFRRQLFGYRRSAVDEHLASVDASIAELQATVERLTPAEDGELVLRATRRAVEEVLERAERDAERIRADAETEAAQVLADAYDIGAARSKVAEVANDISGDDNPIIDLRRPPVDNGSDLFADEVADVLGD